MSKSVPLPPPSLPFKFNLVNLRFTTFNPAIVNYDAVGNSGSSGLDFIHTRPFYVTEEHIDDERVFSTVILDAQRHINYRGRIWR